jgi:hypothetical protein
MKIRTQFTRTCGKDNFKREVYTYEHSHLKITELSNKLMIHLKLLEKKNKPILKVLDRKK